MRRSFLFFLALLFLSSGGLDLGAQSVAVLNRTGYDILAVYISPGFSDSWGENLLRETEILSNNSSSSVTVSGLDTTCIFDLKALDIDNDSYVKWNIDLCKSKKIILTLDDLTTRQGNPSGTGEEQDFVLVNNTGFTIWHIYVSPSYSDNWEDDLLGESDILETGEGFSVTFSGYDDHCIFDIKLVDQEGDTYIKYALDLCSLHEVIFTLDDLVY